MNMHLLPPAAFRSLLAEAGIQRFFLVWDEDAGELRASHPLLAPLARLLAADRRDFDRHEGVFVQIAPASGVLQGAFVHRTCRGQAAGGVRYWRYPTIEHFLRDGLRLARGMTHKNALAGLWWGGGKGVMVHEPAAGAAGGAGAGADAAADRRLVYEEYGDFLTSLRGCYVTAEDVGTSPQDMAAIFRRTRFTTCIPPELGGSGNPSAPTARGVVRGMEAALAWRRQGTLAGKTVTVQGLGHVGEPLVDLLRQRGVARVVGTDIDAARVAALTRRHAAAAPGFALQARAVAPDDDAILAEPADIFAPCATGGILGPDTIPRLAAGIVCGAANNQLLDADRDDLLLHQRGILYMPDFLVNRMGIVNCADEQYGYVGDEDPRLLDHLGSPGADSKDPGQPAGQAAADRWDNSIYNLSLAILRDAQHSNQPPARIALRLAEQRSRDPHPLWGHRGAAIIRALTRPGPAAWHHASTLPAR